MANPFSLSMRLNHLKRTKKKKKKKHSRLESVVRFLSENALSSGSSPHVAAGGGNVDGRDSDK